MDESILTSERPNNLENTLDALPEPTAAERRREERIARITSIRNDSDEISKHIPNLAQFMGAVGSWEQAKTGGLTYKVEADAGELLDDIAVILMQERTHGESRYHWHRAFGQSGCIETTLIPLLDHLPGDDPRFTSALSLLTLFFRSPDPRRCPAPVRPLLWTAQQQGRSALALRPATLAKTTAAAAADVPAYLKRQGRVLPAVVGLWVTMLGVTDAGMTVGAGAQTGPATMAALAVAGMFDIVAVLVRNLMQVDEDVVIDLLQITSLAAYYADYAVVPTVAQKWAEKRETRRRKYLQIRAQAHGQLPTLRRSVHFASVTDRAPTTTPTTGNGNGNNGNNSGSGNSAPNSPFTSSDLSDRISYANSIFSTTAPTAGFTNLATAPPVTLAGAPAADPRDAPRRSGLADRAATEKTFTDTVPLWLPDRAVSQALGGYMLMLFATGLARLVPAALIVIEGRKHQTDVSELLGRLFVLTGGVMSVGAGVLHRRTHAANKVLGMLPLAPAPLPENPTSRESYLFDVETDRRARAAAGLTAALDRLNSETPLSVCLAPALNPLLAQLMSEYLAPPIEALMTTPAIRAQQAAAVSFTVLAFTELMQAAETSAAAAATARAAIANNHDYQPLPSYLYAAAASPLTPALTPPLIVPGYEVLPKIALFAAHTHALITPLALAARRRTPTAPAWTFIRAAAALATLTQTLRPLAGGKLLLVDGEADQEMDADADEHEHDHEHEGEHEGDEGGDLGNNLEGGAGEGAGEHTSYRYSEAILELRGITYEESTDYISDILLLCTRGDLPGGLLSATLAAACTSLHTPTPTDAIARATAVPAACTILRELIDAGEAAKLLTFEAVNSITVNLAIADTPFRPHILQLAGVAAQAAEQLLKDADETSAHLWFMNTLTFTASGLNEMYRTHRSVQREAAADAVAAEAAAAFAAACSARLAGSADFAVEFKNKFDEESLATLAAAAGNEAAVQEWISRVPGLELNDVEVWLVATGAKEKPTDHMLVVPEAAGFAERLMEASNMAYVLSSGRWLPDEDERLLKEYDSLREDEFNMYSTDMELANRAVENVAPELSRHSPADTLQRLLQRRVRDRWMNSRRADAVREFLARTAGGLGDRRPELVCSGICGLAGGVVWRKIRTEPEVEAVVRGGAGEPGRERGAGARSGARAGREDEEELIHDEEDEETNADLGQIDDALMNDSFFGNLDD